MGKRNLAREYEKAFMARYGERVLVKEVRPFFWDDSTGGERFVVIRAGEKNPKFKGTYPQMSGEFSRKAFKRRIFRLRKRVLNCAK